MVMPIERFRINANELKYFTAFFVFICLLSACPYTNWLFRPALAIVLAYGLIMLVRFFGQGKLLIKKPLFMPLFLFSAIYCLNILWHIRDGLFTFVTNGGQMTLACLYFFIFFFQFSMLDSKERAEILQFSFNIYIWGALFFSVVSLVMLLFQYSSAFSINGTVYRIGMNGRAITNGVVSYQLFGIGTSSSILGSICLTGTLISVVSLWLNGKNRQRFYSISIVIFMLTLCAANAFTSVLMAMVFAASYVGCHYLTSIISLHGACLVKRICKLIIMVLGTLISVYVLYYAVQGAEASVVNLFERTRVTVCTFIEKMEESISHPTLPEVPPDGEEPNEFAKPEITEKPPMTIERTLTSSIYSGRLTIWAEGFQKFLQHPIFGVTNENISVYVNDRDRQYVNLHNAYLMLLVGPGIVGVSLIFFFGLSLLIKALRFISSKSGNIVKHLSILVSACLAILAGDFVNGNFVFAPSESYIFLWMFLGEIYGITFAQSEPASLKEMRLES